MVDSPESTVVLPEEVLADRVAARARRAMLVLRECIEIDPAKLGGVPLLKGTRFSIPQLFAEISDLDDIERLAEEFDLSEVQVRSLLQAFAVFLDQPMAK